MFVCSVHRAHCKLYPSPAPAACNAFFRARLFSAARAFGTRWGALENEGLDGVMNRLCGVFILFLFQKLDLFVIYSFITQSIFYIMHEHFDARRVLYMVV